MADARYGCYNVLLLTTIIKAFAACFAFIGVQWNVKLTFYIACFLLLPLSNVGAATIASMLGKQYDVSTISKSNQLACSRRAYGWLYVSNILGGICALLITPYMSNFAKFSIPVVMFVIAVLVLILLRKHYMEQPVDRSKFRDVVRVLKDGARCSASGRWYLASLAIMVLVIVVTIVTNFSKDGTSLHLAGSIVQCTLFVVGSVVLLVTTSNLGWIMSLGSGDGELGAGVQTDWTFDQVSIVSILLKLSSFLVILGGFYIPVGYLNGLYTLQACQMDLEVFGATVSPISTAAFIMVSMVITALLLDYMVYPIIGKMTGNKQGPTELQKINAAYLTIILSMIVMIGVELWRKNVSTIPGVYSPCAPPGVEIPVSSLSVMWFWVPSLVMGLAVSIMAAPLMNFLYLETPESMRSLGLLVQILARGFADIIAHTILNWGQLIDWLPTDLSEGHVEYVLLVSIVLSIGGYLLFVHWKKSFLRKEHLM